MIQAGRCFSRTRSKVAMNLRPYSLPLRVWQSKALPYLAHRASLAVTDNGSLIDGF